MAVRVGAGLTDMRARALPLSRAVPEEGVLKRSYPSAYPSKQHRLKERGGRVLCSWALPPGRDQFRLEWSNTVITGKALPSSSKKPRVLSGPATAGSHQKTPLPRS